MTARAIIAGRPYVEDVSDERDSDSGIHVALRDGYEFVADPGCGTRSFDTFAEALAGTRSGAVRKVQA